MLNKNDSVMVAGDLNARISNTSVRRIVGTKAEHVVSKNGQKSIEFTMMNNFRITKIFCRRKNIHNYAWKPRRHSSLMDYVLVNKNTWPSGMIPEYVEVQLYHLTTSYFFQELLSMLERRRMEHNKNVLIEIFSK